MQNPLSNIKQGNYIPFCIHFQRGKKKKREKENIFFCEVHTDYLMIEELFQINLKKISLKKA